MTLTRNATSGTTMQYLVWALEGIKEGGNQTAAHHIRMALEELRKGSRRSADMTDEHAT